MARGEKWVMAGQAAEVLSAAIGRPMVPSYIRKLARGHKIRSKRWEKVDGGDGKTNLYPVTDLVRYGEEHNPDKIGRTFGGGSTTHKRRKPAAATAVK